LGSSAILEGDNLDRSKLQVRVGEEGRGWAVNGLAELWWFTLQSAQVPMVMAALSSIVILGLVPRICQGQFLKEITVD